MLDFQVPRITSESVEENRGSFAIEPLDRGFGYTFGNSLRRVLLSSLAGAAVTSVRIEGVAHEFVPEGEAMVVMSWNSQLSQEIAMVEPTTGWMGLVNVMRSP